MWVRLEGGARLGGGGRPSFGVCGSWGRISLRTSPKLASLHGMNPSPESPKQGPRIILAIVFGVVILLVCILAVLKLS